MRRPIYECTRSDPVHNDTRRARTQTTTEIPLQTDNSTANGIMNRTIKRKRSKAFDMRHWWLVDRCDQGQFKVYWAPGKISLADYFTKRHPASHHAALRPIYLYEEGKSPNTVQGCIEILSRANQPSSARS